MNQRRWRSRSWTSAAATIARCADGSFEVIARSIPRGVRIGWVSAVGTALGQIAMCRGWWPVSAADGAGVSGADGAVHATSSSRSTGLMHDVVATRVPAISPPFARRLRDIRRARRSRAVSAREAREVERVGVGRPRAVLVLEPEIAALEELADLLGALGACERAHRIDERAVGREPRDDGIAQLALQRGHAPGIVGPEAA